MSEPTQGFAQLKQLRKNQATRKNFIDLTNK